MTLRLKGKSLHHSLVSHINTSKRKHVPAEGGTNRKRSGRGRGKCVPGPPTVPAAIVISVSNA